MAAQNPTNQSQSNLPTDIDIIIKELAALDHLDLLGVDLDVTRRDLEIFKRGPLADFDRKGTRGARSLNLLHERLKTSVDDQVLERVLVEGNAYPRTEIVGVVAKTLEHVAKKHYEATTLTNTGFIPLSDVDSPKNPLSAALSLPEKEYIVETLSSLSQGAQQAIAQSLARSNRLRDLPFKSTLSSIENAARTFAVDAKVAGLSHEYIASNHFSDVAKLNAPNTALTDTQMIMAHIDESWRFSKLPLNLDSIEDKLTQTEVNLPAGVSSRIKNAVLHHTLQDMVIEQVRQHSTAQILSISTMQDVHSGLHEVAKEHYDRSPTSYNFIPTYSMHTTLTHAPFPDSLSADQYKALSASTEHLSQGARQYVAANLTDERGDPSFDFDKSVGVIRRSLLAFDGAVAHVGMVGPTHTLSIFENKLAAIGDISHNPAAPEPLSITETNAFEPSDTLNQLMVLIDKEGFDKASKLDISQTRDTLATFESNLPADTDKTLHMALLHHELEQLAINSTKAQFKGKEQIAGSPNPAFESAMKATKLESFYTARAHYDLALTDDMTKTGGFIRFLSRDDRGNLEKAPFPSSLGSEQHSIFLKTMSDFTQGQKQMIGAGLRELAASDRGATPELSINAIKIALTKFDDAYQQACPDTYIDSIADFDVRYKLTTINAKNATNPTDTSSKIGSKPANIATKYDFGDSYANMMLDGLSKDGSQLKKRYNDPKSTIDMLYNGTKDFLNSIDNLSGHSEHLSKSAQGDEARLDLIKKALGRLGDIKENLARDAGKKGFLNERGNISLNAHFDRTTAGIEQSIKITDAMKKPVSEPAIVTSPRPMAN